MTTATRSAYEAPKALQRVQQAGPARLLRKGIISLLRVVDRQRQRCALLDLDDRMLNDIGKSRQEALDEGRKPFWK